jgi:hypothetical protein
MKVAAPVRQSPLLPDRGGGYRVNVVSLELAGLESLEPRLQYGRRVWEVTYGEVGPSLLTSRPRVV